MKQTIPARVVEVCDFCHREGFLTKCVACGKGYCLTCQGGISGCVVAPDVCKACDERDDVWKICKRYASKIAAVAKRRDAELTALKENADG